jgi:uncharacterized protein YcgL (UPF0745 family)
MIHTVPRQLWDEQRDVLAWQNRRKISTYIYVFGNPSVSSVPTHFHEVFRLLLLVMRFTHIGIICQHDGANVEEETKVNKQCETYLKQRMHLTSVGFLVVLAIFSRYCP